MKLRLLLNADFTGPHAWFFLAQERGYFRDRGLDLELLPGAGAAAIVPQVGTAGIDAGYGDINALAEWVAREPATAPVGVFQSFNRSPFTIAVRADSPIRQAADLVGRRLVGKPDDAAMLLFPALALAAGFDPAATEVSVSHRPMGEQVRDLLMTGACDGVFGFVNTIIAASTPLGVDSAQLRFLEYADLLPDLYGNGLMVAREVVVRAPEAVRALVHGLNAGVRDTVADIDAAMAALQRAAPSIDLPVQRRRLLGTLRAEMAHPELTRIGLGDVDDARLSRGLVLLARSAHWARVPAAGEVFDRRFLPPLGERVRSVFV